MGLRKQEATDIECGEGFIDLKIASNPKHVESNNDSDDLQSREIITISDNPFGTQSLNGITKTENQTTTINNLPPEIIMNVCDSLTPCMIACLGLTCRQFYATCKLHHPRPSSLALHVDRPYHPAYNTQFCNSMYCIHYPPGADIFVAKFTKPERLRFRRSLSSNFVPDAWCPRRNGHLGDLIETWEGLRYYRKTWLNVRKSPNSSIVKYLSLFIYNPSNENCKAKLALEDRYSDFYRKEPIRDKWWTTYQEYVQLFEKKEPILPNPHQMASHAWLLQAKEIILGDRFRHVSKARWAHFWANYIVGKNCRDFPDELSLYFFSEWKEMMGL